MDCESIFFSGHALRRMFERGITVSDVINVLKHGEAIAEYPADLPFASALMLGYVEGNPLHVVVARDEVNGDCYVITAYIPDLAFWEAGFKNRRDQ